ncbi:sodium:proton exchanger [Candidatus Peregrinibacteria bacterium CG_4_10_14_0_2_um_filter_38_24]|nr:MAG: sodium:proton exchanger [Candidatus Peregrinibacteria bacterium CG_4_10_14_0_2_um_filter_38_24]PJC38976.1 MAG: sodium:proton exchanger [Candidatus Peregrinibacteria bacterium CG_4_9_14_0_2_um_filter_38_9]
MILSILWLTLGFFLLIKGAAYLIEGSSSIAERLNIPHSIIGLTVVAFGTSIPELAIGVSSALKGNTDIAIANIIGSNISNILLILGASLLISKIKIDKDILKEQIPFSIFAGILIAILGLSKLITGGPMSLSLIDGVVLLILLFVFLHRAYQKSKAHKDYKDFDKIYPANFKMTASVFLIIGGLIGLTIGGKLVVENAVAIATLLGLSETLIGLTIVAVGTSLPELFTSIVASLKKKTDLAIGNIIGSNIFNIFGILGVSTAIRPIVLKPEIMQDIGIMTAVGLFTLLVAMKAKNHIVARKTGIIFLVSYVSYVVFIAFRG